VLTALIAFVVFGLSPACPTFGGKLLLRGDLAEGGDRRREHNEHDTPDQRLRNVGSG
jgi:hypothetical protein